MPRRLIAYVLLSCYGVIALYGQGLHSFLDDDCDQPEPSAMLAVILQSSNLSSLSVGQFGQAQEHAVIESSTGGHAHDCDHCPICQQQSQEQHFVAPAPAQTSLALCDTLPPGRAIAVHCSAAFSPTQPRAPPATS